MSCPAHPSIHEDGCEPCRANMWMNAAQMSAASSLRMAGIVEKADALALELERMLEAAERTPEFARWRGGLVQRALEAYKIVRQGQ